MGFSFFLYRSTTLCIGNGLIRTYIQYAYSSYGWLKFVKSCWGERNGQHPSRDFLLLTQEMHTCHNFFKAEGSQSEQLLTSISFLIDSIGCILLFLLWVDELFRLNASGSWYGSHIEHLWTSQCLDFMSRIQTYLVRHMVEILSKEMTLTICNQMEGGQTNQIIKTYN